MQVGLPTNFKAARFGAEESTALLRRLEADIDQARFDPSPLPLSPAGRGEKTNPLSPAGRGEKTNPLSPAGRGVGVRGDCPLEIPVRFKVHVSLFVPLAKWPMLMAGNYRCIRRDGMIPIREAVHADPARSQAMYDWVCKLCKALGALDADLVPFERYAKADRKSTRLNSSH